MTDPTPRADPLREALELARDACGSFLWLQNNLHNRDSTTFHELLDGALEDARRGYDTAQAALAATPAHPEPETVDWQGVASDLAPPTLAEWEAVVARHTTLALLPTDTEAPK